MRTTMALLSALFLASCVDTLQDAAHPPGQMDASGRIYPCHDGNQTNSYAETQSSSRRRSTPLRSARRKRKFVPS